MTFESGFFVYTVAQMVALGRLRDAELAMYSCTNIDELRVAAISYCNMMDAYYNLYGKIYLEGVEWDNRRKETA